MAPTILLILLKRFSTLCRWTCNIGWSKAIASVVLSTERCGKLITAWSTTAFKKRLLFKRFFAFGDTMSTSGGVQYIGGIPWVHQGVFSTSEGYHEYIRGYHEYIGGCSVHRGDIMIHVGGYHEYIGGCSVHRGDTMSTLGDTMSTLGDTMSTLGGYHEYIGGISWVHRGTFSTSEFSIEIERILSSCSPTCIMIFLRCTEHPPMYSWYPPDVLMVSLRCTEHPPMYSWYPPTFIMISPPMYWTSPMYSWYPPDVLMISPWRTEHPPMYWTSPDVLNTHYTGCLHNRLYRVLT